MVLTFKNPKVTKKKKFRTHFSPAFFLSPLICVANKKMFSVHHIGHVKMFMFCCFAGNVVLHSPRV
jgi:hypothetical protein